MNLTLAQFLDEARGKLLHLEIPEINSLTSTGSPFNPIFNDLHASVFVIDFRNNSIPYISENADLVTGYTAKETMEMGVDNYMKLYHPTDLKIINEKIFPGGNAAMFKLPQRLRKHFKVSFNFRLRQKDDAYKHLLLQFSVLLFDNKNKLPLVILGTSTQLENAMVNNTIHCQVFLKNPINTWQKIHSQKYEMDVDALDSPIKLTNKEKQILVLAAAGKASKEIAAMTGNSIETIHKHRKNILAKTQTANILEAAFWAKKHGLLDTE